MTTISDKPRVSPYVLSISNQHVLLVTQRKWICHSHCGMYTGTGYSVEDAYFKWLAALTCRPVWQLRREARKGH